MNDLFRHQQTPACGPVECLGLSFPNDAARREHFMNLLREKLKDPEFRKIEGFPIGSDEDILALSDPPYYTACPNPFIEDFIKYYGKPYDPDVPYSKEPFATDVSEGKNDPIYNAHSYHTKVPHKAIMRYILHYTEPGDIVFDGFCGTGMTGVAAQLCGDKKVVESLGYRVDADGTIYTPEQEDGKTVWKRFSKLGVRRAILNDLSPAATFIAYNYNTPVDVYAFEREAKRILAEVERECGWMYQTLHQSKPTQIEAAINLLESSEKPNLNQVGLIGRINYTVWSDVFTCPECAGEVVFWGAAVDKEAGKVHNAFPCPHCNAELTKRNMERAWVTKFDSAIKQTIRQAKQVPVLINYSIGKQRIEKTPDAFDLALIKKIEQIEISYWFPTDRMIEGGETRRNDPIGITHVHHFFSQRNRVVFASLFSRINGSHLKLALLGGYTVGLKTARFLPLRWIQKDTGPMKPHTTGTLYIPSIGGEQNWINIFESRTQATKRAVVSFLKPEYSILSASSMTELGCPPNLIDYIFIDPPFGSNLNYSELNFFGEAWLKVFTNNKLEAIENKVQGKTLDDYRRLMVACFKEAFRILKPSCWMTVEFSNTQASVWNTIQTALQEAGFIVANVAALDKKQGSFKAVTTTTAVKQDLVISAYKPNGGLEVRFAQTGGNEESVWDFVRNHLKYLPTVKLKNSELEFIAERDPRILFDRMVAWFVRHNTLVPLSSQEFQEGLHQRFIERDGMFFLPDQVAEYDRKRLAGSQAPQMELFVSDERSAIDWLTDFLKKRPSTYQEVHPEFISQLGAGWRKHEAKPELSALLEDNFLRYEGTGQMPGQIHSYLSSNFKDLRGLEKTDLKLIAKAKDRWYVPDPNKAQDLEKKRERALLKEFETYRQFTGRRLKEFRLEVMRAGFKHAWANKDYATIIAIARKIPDEALQEDEKLLLWYDQAMTRLETQA